MKSIYILKVYWDKKQILIIIIIIIIIINKINVTKTALLSLPRVPAYHRFNFNSQFLYELKHMVHLCKTVYEIFHFQFRLVFINFYIFFSTKTMVSLTFKRHNSLQNKNNTKVTHSFALRPLIFTLQQEVWKFNDTCGCWSSPRTHLETNFLNLKNRSFEYVPFSQ